MRDRAADARRRPTSSQPRSVASGRTVAEVAKGSGRRGPRRLTVSTGSRPKTGTGSWPRASPTGTRRCSARLTERAVLGPGLAVRAQARRRAGAGLPRPRPGPAAAPQSGGAERQAIPSWSQRSAGRPAPISWSTARWSPSKGRAPASPACSSGCRSTTRARALSSGVTVHYYLFDLLHLEGHDLRALPLRRRKALLRAAIAFDDPLRFTAHRNAAGEALFRDACAQGWEGLIAKRASAPYQGGRTSDWLKFKCSEGQELVIGGFSAPRGSRRGFGALLLGYYDGAGLRYAGKVGTGFDERTLVDLRRRLDRLASAGSPFQDEIRDSSVTFVQPRLVAEIGFTEWTADGRLRHPRFLGLRRDKPPQEVGRERTDP